MLNYHAATIFARQFQLPNGLLFTSSVARNWQAGRVNVKEVVVTGNTYALNVAGAVSQSQANATSSAELVQNGAFVGSVGWSQAGHTTFTGGLASISGANGQELFQPAAVPTTAGRRVKITYTISGYGAGALQASAWKSTSGGGGQIGGSQALSQNRGALTRTGAGAVNIGSIAAVPFVATGATFTQTGGTVGHWTLTSDGLTPTPSAAGDTADLSGGPYTFSWTATDGLNSYLGTLTIAIKPNTYTVSLRSEISISASSSVLLSAGIDGKTVELARGATDFALATAAAPIYFAGWLPASSCLVTQEDVTHPAKVGNLYIRCCNNVNFANIDMRPSARSVPTAIDKAFFVNTLTPSSFGLASTFQCNTTFTNCGVTGDGSSSHTTQGFYIQASGCPIGVTYIGTLYQQWVQDAFNIYDSGDKGVYLNADLCDVRTRYYTGDACFITAGASSLGYMHFNRLGFMSPMFDPTRSAIHADTIQISSGVPTMEIRINEFTHILADGNLSGCQTFFSQNGSLLNLTIRNAIACSRSVHTLTLAASDATHQIKVGNYTGIFQMSGLYGVEDTATVRNDHPDGAFAPTVRLASTINAAYITLQDIFMPGILGNSSAYVMPASCQFMNNNYDLTPYFPNSAWISSPTLRAKMTDPANDIDYYSGLDDVRWHDDWDTVYQRVIDALTPVGARIGAVAPDGTRPQAF